MTALSIYLFGGVQVVRNESHLVRLRPMAKAVLAYLLLHHNRNPHQTGQRREVLANHFWGEHDDRQARRCLSTTLWRLRRELETGDTPQGTYLLATTSGEISFNFESDHWLDVATFEEKIELGMAEPLATMTAANAKALKEAQELYSGELLADSYGDWVFRERERLNLLYLNSLARLMRYHELHDNYVGSLVYGQKILAIDPLREQIHRHIMRLYLRNGQRAMAAQQYEICRKVLADELGIQPMIETRTLYDQIIAESGSQMMAAVADSSKPRPLVQALRQLKTAMHNLNQAQTQLQQAKQTVSRLVEIGVEKDVTLEIDELR